MATLCASVGFGLHSLSCESRGRLIYKITAFALLFEEDLVDVLAQKRKKLEVNSKLVKKVLTTFM
jgi:hypothetical protein